MKLCAIIVTTSLFISQPALAAPRIDVHSIIVGDEGARFVKGVPTLDLQMQRGAVQIRPLGFDHGRLVFGLAFYNDSAEPANIGLEGIHVDADGRPLRIFTVQELVRKEKNRAMWTQIGLGLLGATASALAASQRNTYYSRMHTPHGTYSFKSSYPSLAGQLQANAIAGNTAYGMASIQHRLDQTVEMLGDQIIQRETIDPGDSYAGKIIIDKVAASNLPQELRFTVDWNGERYPFAFVIVKSGQAVPDRYATTLAVNARPKLVERAPRDIPAGAQGQVVVARASIVGRQGPMPGAFMLRSGAMKVPATTKSGYCLRTPPGYSATGSIDFPTVTAALPRCS